MKMVGGKKIVIILYQNKLTIIIKFVKIFLPNFQDFWTKVINVYIIANYN